ncbi:MAG TPA: hypothetical protein PL055_02500 [Methanobacterium sp.]|nr:hypothetical protein [Methanobacterium sp.]
MERKNIDDYYERLSNGESIIIEEFSGKTKHIATSGSTTGKHTYVLVNKEQLELRMAAERWTNSWTGWEMGDPWCHYWYPAISDNFYRRFRLKIAYNLDNGLFLSYFNLNDKMMENHYKKLQSFQPKLLIGYSEAVNMFAEFILRTKKDPLNIPASITSGGQLFPEWRTNIEEAFDGKVYNRYGSSEFGTVAHEDKSGKMKILTNRGISVKNDEENKLLITDINNRATIFKDHFIGDYGKVIGDEITELKGKVKGGRSYLRINQE